jgi:hypothetical protein
MQTEEKSFAGQGAESSLKVHSLRVERKHFTFDIRENPRGKFLRITEEVNGRYDAIIIPLSGIAEFRDIINEVVKAAQTDKPA